VKATIHALVALLLASSTLACGETTKQPLTMKPNGMTTGGEPSATGGSGPGAGGASGASGGTAPLSCTSPQPGATPLLGLDNRSLRNTARDLLQSAPSLAAKMESELGRLPPDASDHSYSRLAIEAIYLGSRAAGTALLADDAALEALTGCDAATADEDACRERFLGRLLRSAFRRPPTTDDLAEMRDVFATGQRLGGDFASGARAVLQVTLQSPEFLYLVEEGTDETVGNTVKLTPHETAARLSYFLTAHPPDEELAAAADAGPFSDDALEEVARRLLGTSPNRQVVRTFMEQLLGLDRTFGSQSSDYTDAIAALAREESGRFVEAVTFDGAGTFEALFSEPTTWVNGPLAQFYGLSGVSGDAFQQIELDPTKRAGILTQAAFLTSHPRIVLRGVTLLARVLCFPLDPPPPDIAITPPAPPVMGTHREQLSVETRSPACQECHRKFEPLGFAFENFDETGRWRDTDNGFPVDASGTLLVTDAQGRFGNAVELVQRIAASNDARSCFASNWLQRAYGRPVSPADACERQRLDAVLEQSGGNIGELLVALAKVDQFRYRLKSELPP
jgi:hypothetical protein